MAAAYMQPRNAGLIMLGKEIPPVPKPLPCIRLLPFLDQKGAFCQPMNASLCSVVFLRVESASLGVRLWVSVSKSHSVSMVPVFRTKGRGEDIGTAQNTGDGAGRMNTTTLPGRRRRPSQNTRRTDTWERREELCLACHSDGGQHVCIGS